MATLYFKVSSDWEQVVKLRQECEKLETQLKKMDSRSAPAATKTLETQLASTKQQMMGLVTEAAKAGAEIENGFKKKIYDASLTVNGLSEKIIAQRAVIKDIEFDVKRLGDAYRTALKNNPIGASGKLAEYNAARKALDEEKAALFGLTQQQAEARLSVKKLRDEYSLYKQEAGETIKTNNGLSLSLGKMLGIIGGATALKSLASQIVRVRGEFQSMQTAIETMVGKDVASGLMTQLKEMAKISPLTLTDMVNAEKMMLGFNIQAEDTVRYLQALSDISMGDSVKFKSLTLAFSQMSAAGKLMGQDLNQMINAGFNPLQIIAEKTGKSIATLKDEMSKGAVSAEMVQQAFIDATSAGGKFYQMSENASKTINGQLSMMQDALDNAFNEMGQASEGVIMEGIQLTTTLIQNYETVGKVLVGLVATYGAYRTAVMLATIATSKHTIAEVALTNARVIARKAQLLLNAAMLTNPYVAVATVITGLVATMWALSDSTTAAEKAQERFSQKSSEMKNKEEERKKSLESLISTINDETTATVARADALNKLKSEYPDIFKKYVDEKGHITDLIELWKEYNDQASVSSRESKQRMVENIDAQIAVTQNNLNTAKANSDWGSVKKYREQLESLQKERAKWVKEVLTDVNRELSVKEEAPKTYAEDYEQARKDWEEAKKELEKIEADKDNFTSKQYEDAKKRVETTEKAYKNLGGLTGTSLIKQQKDAEKKKENQQKVSDELLSLRQKNQEQETALMEEGTAKKLKQIDDDYESQKAEIEKKARELAELNRKSGISGTNANGLTAEQQAEIDRANKLNNESRNKQSDKVYKAEREAMRNYLQEYGTFQQQKLAIAEEYAEKIAKAQSEGERITLEKQRDAAIAQVNTNALKMDIDWATAFSELDGTFSEVIKPVLDKIKEYAKTEEFRRLDASDQQSVIKAISRMEESVGGLGKVKFSDLGKQVDTLRQNVLDLNSAKEEEAEAVEKLQNAQEDYEKALKDGTQEQIDISKLALDDAQNKADAASKNVENQQNIVRNSSNQLNSTVTTLDAKLKNVTQGFQQLSSGGLSNLYQGITKLVKGFGGTAEKLGDVEFIGAIFSALDALKEGISPIVEDVIGNVFGVLNNTVSDIFSGDIFVSLFDSLRDGIGGFWDAITFGGFSSWTDGNAKEVNDTINRLTERNEALQGSIDALNDTIKQGRGTISVEASRQAYEYQKEQNRNYLDMARAQAGYHNSHHSWQYYMGWSQDWIDWIRENIDETFSGTDSLWSWTPEQMQMLKSNVEIWTAMQNAGEGGYGGRVTEKLDAYIKQAGKLEDITNDLYEGLTQISFDSMYSSFIDSLMDMKYDAEAAADDISEYFMRAMLSNKIGEMYYDKLEGWWKKFGESMEDNELSESERNALANEYMKYVNEALNLRDQLAAATGYDKIGEEAKERQSASSGGYETMTQDQASELNGRFTALNESSLRQEAIQQGISDIADDMRNIIAQSYIELQQISENTGDSAKYLKDIKADISIVKQNTSRI
ncbi:tape measure protein [Bacteroides sp. An322]|uniref:tape measure protein n=1 Tax=Bacteroides sp. An322 TaxID=1965632 RepID=UPI000B3826B5|nr:tape measure protein [Bacteroides sp. An322]OUO23707.1 phage tail tape measure protein [Bacteroides sp. An322]